MAAALTAPARALKALLADLPITEQQQQEAERLVKQCTTEELAALGLGPPARPVVPKGLEKLPMGPRLLAVQRVIASLEYNHYPGYFYNVIKARPFARLMDTARDMLREALPIKCIEAVFLGGLLTCGWEELDRLPVGFKSRVGDQSYRHIVLAVHHPASGQWGALGISRRRDLMDKPLGSHGSLADLMQDYKAAYEGWHHALEKVHVGLPLEHSAHDPGYVYWRHCNVSVAKHAWSRCRNALDKFEANYKRLHAKYKAMGSPGPPPKKQQHQQQGGAGKAPAARPAAGPTSQQPDQAAHAPYRTAASVSPARRRPSKAAAPAAAGPKPHDPPGAAGTSPSHGPSGPRPTSPDPRHPRRRSSDPGDAATTANGPSVATSPPASPAKPLSPSRPAAGAAAARSAAHQQQQDGGGGGACSGSDSEDDCSTSEDEEDDAGAGYLDADGCSDGED